MTSERFSRGLCSVAFETQHRSESGLEAAVVGFDPWRPKDRLLRAPRRLVEFDADDVGDAVDVGVECQERDAVAARDRRDLRATALHLESSNLTAR